METCLRGTVAGGMAVGAHECLSNRGRSPGCFVYFPATMQFAPSRGVRSSHGGGAAVQQAVLSAPARRPGSTRMQRQRRIAPAASAATDAPPVAERLSGADAEQWSAAVEEVKKVGYSEEDAQALLERAFGWRTQTFWRGLKKEEVPQAEEVAATLDCLRELGLKDADIQAAFKKFPEGLASDVEGRLKPNVQTMLKEQYIPQKGLLGAIKRQPKALGFSYDCEGSCEGECHRCWVRF